MLHKVGSTMVSVIYDDLLWRKANFPIKASTIADEIQLFLIIEFLNGNRLSVKKLFYSVPFSYTAVRIHYKTLCNENWIEHSVDSFDGRIKYIQPTEKFRLLINSYLDFCLSRITPPPPQKNHISTDL